MSVHNLVNLFHIDGLSWIMMALIGYLALTITSFAQRYMHGDSHYKQFFIHLFLLTFSLFLLVISDNLFVFATAWLVSNLLLVRLMIHKGSWRAAKASGYLALKALVFGSGCLFAVCGILAHWADVYSLHQLASIPGYANSMVITCCCLLIIMASVAQSALWPMQRWLVSSLNSPTPVSAFMHAGLVNGGGLLLVRFSPLFFQQTLMFDLIICFGLISVVLGTLWKLIQTDVKRMLACSTLAQMGFMFIQCGLGLFSAAIAHLCLHGMFKAYLFLSSGSVAQEKRAKINDKVKLATVLWAIPFGCVGATIFSYIVTQQFFPANSTLVLITIAFISSTQLAMLVKLDNFFTTSILRLLVISVFIGGYGFVMHCIEYGLQSMQLWQPQSLNLLHQVTIVMLLTTWTMHLLFKAGVSSSWLTKLKSRFYVMALNASQPQPETTTAHRNHYSYR